MITYAFCLWGRNTHVHWKPQKTNWGIQKQCNAFLRSKLSSPSIFEILKCWSIQWILHKQKINAYVMLGKSLQKKKCDIAESEAHHLLYESLCLGRDTRLVDFSHLLPILGCVKSLFLLFCSTLWYKESGSLLNLNVSQRLWFFCLFRSVRK